MNVVIYGNGSAENHGCEAIVRGTAAVLGSEHRYVLYSARPEDDIRYGLDRLTEIRPAVLPIKRNIRFIMAYLKMKTTGNYTDIDGLSYVPGIRQAARECSVAVSVGGDNYCYPGTEIYGWLNREYRKHGMKTVLWGCSVEPEIVQKAEVARDLALYDLIVARESITYEAIRQVQPNTILAPDPAFFMEAKTCPLDKRMASGNAIGINISPMIISAEKASGMAYENYKQLISYILQNTDSYIALIPHVVWASNDDRTVLRRLYDDFDRDSRLILVEDHPAPQLKYIISKCSFFIGARTHATIAAYSSCVPTLVVGYSVKARGIARDLFGNEDGYVIPVQELSEKGQMTSAFQNLWSRRNSIQKHLQDTIPEYVKSASNLELLLRQLGHI